MMFLMRASSRGAVTCQGPYGQRKMLTWISGAKAVPCRRRPGVVSRIPSCSVSAWQSNSTAGNVPILSWTVNISHNQSLFSFVQQNGL